MTEHQDDRRERISIPGLVIVGLVLILVVGGLRFRAVTNEMSQRDARLSSLNQQLTEKNSQLVQRQKLLRAYLERRRHFALDESWVETGHVGVVTQRGVRECFDCHTRGEEFCVECHVRGVGER
ncbi:MAG: hypothetical protein HY876_08725 [Coriobacteriales bacterium]|nr:hypothetical protein [Coriobacteriales bacterium]